MPKATKRSGSPAKFPPPEKIPPRVRGKDERGRCAVLRTDPDERLVLREPVDRVRQEGDVLRVRLDELELREGGVAHDDDPARCGPCRFGSGFRVLLDGQRDDPDGEFLLGPLPVLLGEQRQAGLLQRRGLGRHEQGHDPRAVRDLQGTRPAQAERRESARRDVVASRKRDGPGWVRGDDVQKPLLADGDPFGRGEIDDEPIQDSHAPPFEEWLEARVHRDRCEHLGVQLDRIEEEECGAPLRHE